MNPLVIAKHQRLLARFDTSKGTIRFDTSRPLPAAVVRKLVKARLLDLTSAAAATGGDHRDGAKPPAGSRGNLRRSITSG